MNAKTRLACRLAATLLALSTGSQASATALTDTATFRAALTASFYGFDICGDAANGALYRKALAQKVEQCPFTADAKAEFRSWSAQAEAREAAKARLYIAEHDKLPERLDRQKRACRTEHESPAYQTTIALLRQFAEGAIGAEAVVPDACDVKAPAP